MLLNPAYATIYQAGMVDNNILLLGMVFSDQLIPSRGQEYRDRVRCVKLQKLGFLKNIQNKLGNDIKLSHIILAYFFCPIGWARTRWLPTFYSKTIP